MAAKKAMNVNIDNVAYVSIIFIHGDIENSSLACETILLILQSGQ